MFGVAIVAVFEGVMAEVEEDELLFVFILLPDSKARLH